MKLNCLNKNIFSFKNGSNFTYFFKNKVLLYSSSSGALEQKATASNYFYKLIL